MWLLSKAAVDILCHNSHSNVYVEGKKTPLVSLLPRLSFCFLSRNVSQNGYTWKSDTVFHPGWFPQGWKDVPGVHLGVSPDVLLSNAGNLASTIPFSRWESAADRTRTQLGLWVLILLENHPSIQSNTKAKRTDLCGLIFPCVWLHARLGGEAGVVTGLWRRAAPCCSVSLGCGLCGRAAIGIFCWPAPAGAPRCDASWFHGPLHDHPCVV